MATLYTLGKSVNRARPSKLEETLANPTQVVGERHAEMLGVVLQLVGDGVPDSEILARMSANYPLRVTTKEISDAIKGAHARNPAPSRARGGLPPMLPVGTQTGTWVPKVDPASIPQEDLPEPMATGAAASIQFLQSVFRPEEVICINNQSDESDGKLIPHGKGLFKPLEWWIEQFADEEKNARKGNFLSNESGAWIRINPCSDESGSDAGVADFRHVLVEIDAPGVTLPEQWGIMKASGQPIAAVLSSGGKSLHAWVQVAACDLNEYKRRRDAVYARLSDCKIDLANKNPSRLSRLPGVQRNGKEQELLSLGMGAPSWSEWERANVAPENDGFPEIVDACDLFDTPMEPPAVIVEGMFHKGTSGMIGGASKAHKTWAMMHIATAIAAGVPWMGRETTQGPVLYVDCELPKYFLRSRLLAVQAALDVRLARGMLDTLSLRGHAADIKQVAQRISARIKNREYSLIVLDPIYKMLGARDENNNGEIAELLNELEWLSKDSGALTLFSHHFSKGNQSAKAGIDRVAGAGAWGRGPDSIIPFTEHKEPSAFSVEPILRNFAPVEAFAVRFKFPLFELALELDPFALKQAKSQAQAAQDANSDITGDPEKAMGFVPEDGTLIAKVELQRLTQIATSKHRAEQAIKLILTQQCAFEHLKPRKTGRAEQWVGRNPPDPQATMAPIDAVIPDAGAPRVKRKQAVERSKAKRDADANSAI
jgi:RecA-family ATPase